MFLVMELYSHILLKLYDHVSSYFQNINCLPFVYFIPFLKLMSAVLWDVKPCGVVEGYRHFRGMLTLSVLYKNELNMEKCSMEIGGEISRIGTIR